MLVSRLFTKLNARETLRRQRHYWQNMAAKVLEPPAEVRGMTELQRDAFTKRVQVPRLRVREEQAQRVLPLVKKLLLKMEQLRPVRPVAAEDNSTPAQREILLHPVPVSGWESLPVAALAQQQVDASNFDFSELQLGYANWRADEIFKSVLPAAEEGLTSYSRIGHIVHLNLRDHLLPYKSLIGQVLIDKVPGCRTVVNKAASIDNTYRNFQLELICGAAEYQVETRENGVAFEFDFAKVYWNPRLSTEHERIVQLLRAGDVLYDVFAGVGPFAVPAARKRCRVLANDLNPESYRWLQHNAKRNKCLAHAQLFNKDGREFILEQLKQDLLRRWNGKDEHDAADYKIHITMNLPALAVEFLDAFRGLFTKAQLGAAVNYPLVHVYAFAKGENTKQLVRSLVEQHLGLPLGDNLEGIHFVRNVAPNKDMYRVSFQLTAEILTTPFVAQKSENLELEKKTEKENSVEEEASSTRKRSAEVLSSDADVESSKVKCN